MTMLALAIKAMLPLVEVTTRDMLNLVDVVQHITGKKPVPYPPAEMKPNTLYFIAGSKARELAHTDLYKKLVTLESTLLIVNTPQPHVLPFKGGEVPVPRELLLKFMMAIVSDEKKALNLLPALGGCTLKEAAEAARLTMARDKSLTAKGLMTTRKTCFHGGKGVTQVDPHQAYYEPLPALQAWLHAEGDYFLTGTDPRLVPRGMLAAGPPGVGKTEGAKWLANQLGIPLYRVDIGGVKNKYVGASEENMLSALSQLDNEEPCVALFDEIEKVFGGNDYDGNTTTSMLSQLLWWLAEHRSRVLTIMTTNNIRKLPPELYRAGRIDVVDEFRRPGRTAGARFGSSCSVHLRKCWIACSRGGIGEEDKADRGNQRIEYKPADCFARSSHQDGARPGEVQSAGKAQTYLAKGLGFKLTSRLYLKHNQGGLFMHNKPQLMSGSFSSESYLMVAKRGDVALGLKIAGIGSDPTGNPKRSYVACRIRSAIYKKGLHEEHAEQEEKVVSLADKGLNLESAWPNIKFTKLNTARASTIMGIFVRGSIKLDPEQVLNQLVEGTVLDSIVDFIIEQAGVDHMVIRRQVIINWLRSQVQPSLVKIRAQKEAASKLDEEIEASIGVAAYEAQLMKALYQAEQEPETEVTITKTGAGSSPESPDDDEDA